MEFLEKNNPFVPQEKNFLGFLQPVSKNNLEEHAVYTDLLNVHPRQYFCVTLLLLSRSTLKNISSQYLTLIDRLKNKNLEVNSNRLDDLYVSDYDVMKTCLQYYTRMISYDVLEALIRGNKLKLGNEQINQLRSIYGSNVIEYFVNDILRDYKPTNFSAEEFFKNYYRILNHTFVRERLRIIYLNNFAPKQPVPAPVEGKIYTLNNNVEFEKPKEIQAPVPQLVSSSYPFREYRPSNDYSGSVPVAIKCDFSSNSDLSRKSLDLVNNYTPPSLVSSSNPVFSTVPPTLNFVPQQRGSYVDPNSNATNVFLYGHKNINSSDILSLDTQKFLILKNFRKNCLDFHNEKRRLHRVPEVTEDLSLTERAQDWANQLAQNDELNYSDCRWDDRNIGENIARAGKVLNDAGNSICKKWYEEVKDFDFKDHSNNPNTYNFIKMIWKECKNVGFGLAFSNSGKTYAVVNYFPGGDYSRNLRENVLPASY